MISIIFCTNRLDPKFSWFIHSLANQTTDEERKNIELIFIDGAIGRGEPHHERIAVIEQAISGRFQKWTHTVPKPNIYQGILRKTKTEMFSPSNARNTGILLSEGSYLVFADDVSVLMPTWWGAVKQAAEQSRIVCGSYQKHFDMVVENGILVSSRYHDAGKDSRWNSGNDHRSVPINGQALFGCSLGIPAKDIIDVNGFDELCDSIGGEDYHLGTRLNNAGKRIYYDRRMFTVESEELHNQPYLMLRDDRLLDPASYMATLKEFGVHTRKYDPRGRTDSSHMLLDILYGLNQKTTMGNNYSIAADRPSHYFVPVPDVTTHWFDKKLLAEL